MYKVLDTESTREFFNELINDTYVCIEINHNYYKGKVISSSYKLDTCVGKVWLNDDEVLKIN